MQMNDKSRRSADLYMKVRRRQSDARWRANVASCYETLKHIIPMNKRASKRQISKAMILQETHKHISFLESILSSLLSEKAEINGKDPVKFSEKEKQKITAEFVEKHRDQAEQISRERKFSRVTKARIGCPFTCHPEMCPDSIHTQAMVDLPAPLPRRDTVNEQVSMTMVALAATAAIQQATDQINNYPSMYRPRASDSHGASSKSWSRLIEPKPLGHVNHNVKRFPRAFAKRHRIPTLSQKCHTKYPSVYIDPPPAPKGRADSYIEGQHSPQEVSDSQKPSARASDSTNSSKNLTSLKTGACPSKTTIHTTTASMMLAQAAVPRSLNTSRGAPSVPESCGFFSSQLVSAAALAQEDKENKRTAVTKHYPWERPRKNGLEPRVNIISDINRLQGRNEKKHHSKSAGTDDDARLGPEQTSKTSENQRSQMVPFVDQRETLAAINSITCNDEDMQCVPQQTTDVLVDDDTTEATKLIACKHKVKRRKPAQVAMFQAKAQSILHHSREGAIRQLANKKMQLKLNKIDSTSAQILPRDDLTSAVMSYTTPQTIISTVPGSGATSLDESPGTLCCQDTGTCGGLVTTQKTVSLDNSPPCDTAVCKTPGGCIEHTPIKATEGHLSRKVLTPGNKLKTEGTTPVEVPNAECVAPQSLTSSGTKLRTKGFTPVKLPPSIHTYSPSFHSQSPVEDNLRTTSLQCDEAFWVSEDEEENEKQNFTIFKNSTKSLKVMHDNICEPYQRCSEQITPKNEKYGDRNTTTRKRKRSSMENKLMGPFSMLQLQGNQLRTVKRRKPNHPKCRRSLENCFPDLFNKADTAEGVQAEVKSDKSDVYSPFLNDETQTEAMVAASNFDGYMMFYKKLLPQLLDSKADPDKLMAINIKSDTHLVSEDVNTNWDVPSPNTKELEKEHGGVGVDVGGTCDDVMKVVGGEELTAASHAIYRMWSDMTLDQKQTMIQLAQAESSTPYHSQTGSDLSDDLMLLDVKPLDVTQNPAPGYSLCHVTLSALDTDPVPDDEDTSGQAVQGVPGEQAVQGIPGGLAVQGVPGGQAVHDVPGGQAMQGTPGGEAVQGIPGGQAVQGVPGPKSTVAQIGGPYTEYPPEGTSIEYFPADLMITPYSTRNVHKDEWLQEHSSKQDTYTEYRKTSEIKCTPIEPSIALSDEVEYTPIEYTPDEYTPIEYTPDECDVVELQYLLPEANYTIVNGTLVKDRTSIVCRSTESTLQDSVVTFNAANNPLMDGVPVKYMPSQSTAGKYISADSDTESSLFTKCEMIENRSSECVARELKYSCGDNHITQDVSAASVSTKADQQCIVTKCTVVDAMPAECISVDSGQAKVCTLVVQYQEEVTTDQALVYDSEQSVDQSQGPVLYGISVEPDCKQEVVETKQCFVDDMLQLGPEESPHNQGEPQESPRNQGKTQQATCNQGEPHEATCNQGEPHQATYNQGEPHQATYSQGEPHQATYNQGEPHQATYSQGEPQEATYNQGEPQEATYNQGEPQEATYNQGEPQKATYNQGEPHQATYSQGEPQEATYNQGEPHQATYSQGEPHQATYSQGEPQEAAYNQGEPQEATYNQRVESDVADVAQNTSEVTPDGLHHVVIQPVSDPSARSSQSKHDKTMPSDQSLFTKKTPTVTQDQLTLSTLTSDASLSSLTSDPTLQVIPISINQPSQNSRSILIKTREGEYILEHELASNPIFIIGNDVYMTKS